eukprot:1180899-Prorocentrum_minimum.AAC.2
MEGPACQFSRFLTIRIPLTIEEDEKKISVWDREPVSSRTNRGRGAIVSQTPNRRKTLVWRVPRGRHPGAGQIRSRKVPTCRNLPDKG